MLQPEAEELAAAYHEQRACSPRRAQGYLSHTRSGITSSGVASNRFEEHLAAGLFLRGALWLPNGERLSLLDYQFPLKSVRADVGIGKVDLLGLYEDGTLAVVELKVVGNREDRRISLLEGLIYAAIIEANIEQIAKEVLTARSRHVLLTRPKILVIAPSHYWSETGRYPSVESVDSLTTAVARAIPIEISFLCLHDANIVALGLNEKSPVVCGHAFLTPLVSAPSQEAPSRRPSQMAYRQDLHRRFWNHGQTLLAARDDLFEPRHIEGQSPPVFRPGSAERNLLLPPSLGPDVGAAITAMIPPAERHRWFASMASSQALAQSVFASLATLGRLDALEGLPAEDGYPAFFEASAGYQLKLEHQVATLGEPRPTSLDVLFDGPAKVGVEVKFTEAEFGRCSRPSLRPENGAFSRDHCDGSFSVQRNRTARCSLSERGILYWRFVPQVFTWTADEDHKPCPLAFTYQLVRSVLAICVGDDAILDTGGGHVLVAYDERNPAFQSGGEADAAWWTVVRALRFPRLLRRVSWQRVAAHLGRCRDLAWLIAGLDEKYGIK